MALLSIMSEDRRDSRNLEDARFRALLIALHPGQAKEILAVLDGATPEDDEIPEFAPELSDEEMEDYQPFSTEEVSQTIGLLRKFGVAVS